MLLRLALSLYMGLGGTGASSRWGAWGVICSRVSPWSTDTVPTSHASSCPLFFKSELYIGTHLSRTQRVKIVRKVACPLSRFCRIVL